MAPASESELSFEKDERILCFHGPLIYEAKVLKAEIWKEGERESGQIGPHYYVHYKGWKQTWDEWVSQDRVLKFNSENQEKQKQLKTSANATQKRSVKTTSLNETTSSGLISNSGSGSTPVRGQKRARDQSIDKEETFISRLDLKISMPDSLKGQLVDDWEYITKNQQLVSLPRSPTVSEILFQYKDLLENDEKVKSTRKQMDILSEVLAGLKTYFNKALGNNLLYRFERHQYVEIRKKYSDKDMCDIYGAEHLLRLFVSMPAMLAQTSMDQDSINILREHILDILKYMVKHQKKLFLQEYQNASPQYQGLARV